MKKGLNKKAQFFLLAAVIISAIVINLGIVANQARITKEPREFNEYSFSIKTETGTVIDFEIYSGIDDNSNLTDFVNKTARDLKDKDPELQFIFIYGDNKNLTIENYGDKEITASMEGSETEAYIIGAGFKINSKIKMGTSSFTEIDTDLLYLDSQKGKWKTKSPLGDINEINLTIEDIVYNFKLSQHKRIVFVVLKEAGNERYIAK